MDPKTLASRSEEKWGWLMALQLRVVRLPNTPQGTALSSPSSLFGLSETKPKGFLLARNIGKDRV